MQPIMVPESPKLRGKKAVEALCDFINELEEKRGKELTEKQTAALIKLAKGLISSIEAEKPASTPDKESKERRSSPQFRRIIIKYIPESVLLLNINSRLWKLTI